MATKVAETNPQRFSIKDNVQINRRNSVPLNYLNYLNKLACGLKFCQLLSKWRKQSHGIHQY